MKEFLQILVKESYLLESKRFIDILVNDKALQQEFIEKNSNNKNSEFQILNWLNNDSFIQALESRDINKLSNMLLLKNNLVRRLYNSEDKSEPNGAIAAIVLGIGGLVAVELVLATDIISNTHLYLATSTKIWGANKTLLTKLSLNFEQKALITALNMLEDIEFSDNVIKNYNILLEELSEHIHGIDLDQKNIKNLLMNSL